MFRGNSMVFKLLSKKLQKLVEKRGFKEPTLVQKLGIPPIISGKNVLLIAPTGVGKTESAMLPIFDEWIKKKPEQISILYITPLKSLNRDMLKRLLWWGNELEMDISVRHGDTSQYARKMQAEVPSDCLITTPETLQAILPAKKMGKHLENIKFVIVDEIHELASSKRGTQLTIGLERLRERTKKDFQIIALSATIGQPKKVVDFISGGKPMEIVKAVETKEIKIGVINPKPIPSDTSLAETVFTNRLTAARLRTVYDLIKNHTSTLTFTNTRDFAEVLTSRLKQAYPKFPVENHHSSLSKEVRIKAENEFKNQKLKSVVCTSSLELGIDIGSIDYIIQYMSPRQTSKAIQRVGRSGHELGRVSDGVIISTDIDDTFESAVIARQGLAEQLEPMKMHLNAFDVLAHQIVGITRDKYRISLDEVYRIIKRAYPYQNLTRKEFMSVCRQLHNLRYAFLNEDNTIKSSRKGLLYYFENLSTIPDTRSYSVINTIANKKVGSLDEEFVALHAQEGVTFIIKGEPWQIITVDGRKIFVEPSGDIDAAIPGWEGDLMPVPFEVAQEVGAVRNFISDNLFKLNKPKIVEEIKKKYPVDWNSAKKMVSTVAKQMKYGIVPTDKNVLIEDHDNVVVLHTCLGTKGNETLGRMLSTILAARIGSVGLKTDPYRVILHLQIMDTDLIEDALYKTKPEHVEGLLELNLSNSRLFQWRFIHVAKRFGVIRKDAEYGQRWLSRIIDLYQRTPVWEETLKEIKTDKLDVEVVKEFLKKIQRKDIAVVFKQGLSPIGKLGIKKRVELIGPEKPELQVLDIFEKRLNEKRVRLICLNCGDWTRTFRVKGLPKEIRCGKCKAKLIGVVRPTQTEYQHIIKKKLAEKPLTTEEMRRLDRIEKTSDLVIVYGPRAVKALAVRGIGPKTATRILRGMYSTEKDFVKALLNAERQFIRTKRFWG